MLNHVFSIYPLNRVNTCRCLEDHRYRTEGSLQAAAKPTKGQVRVSHTALNSSSLCKICASRQLSSAQCLGSRAVSCTCTDTISRAEECVTTRRGPQLLCTAMAWHLHPPQPFVVMLGYVYVPGLWIAITCEDF